MKTARSASPAGETTRTCDSQSGRRTSQVAYDCGLRTPPRRSHRGSPPGKGSKLLPGPGPLPPISAFSVQLERETVHRGVARRRVRAQERRTSRAKAARMFRDFVERRQNVRISGGIHVGRAGPREVGHASSGRGAENSLEEVFGRELLMGFHEPS